MPLLVWLNRDNSDTYSFFLDKRDISEISQNRWMSNLNYADSLVSSSFGTTAGKTERWKNFVDSYTVLFVFFFNFSFVCLFQHLQTIFLQEDGEFVSKFQKLIFSKALLHRKKILPKNSTFFTIHDNNWFSIVVTFNYWSIS